MRGKIVRAAAFRTPHRIDGSVGLVPKVRAAGRTLTPRSARRPLRPDVPAEQGRQEEGLTEARGGGGQERLKKDSKYAGVPA